MNEGNPTDIGLFEVMYQCRAMRRLKPDPVPKPLLVELVKAAIHAPSAGNGQRWRFVIVRETAQKKRVADVWKRGYGFYKDTVLRAGPREHEDAAAFERTVRAQDYLVDHLEEVPAFICVGIKEDSFVSKATSSPSSLIALFRNLGIGGLRTVASVRRSQALTEHASAFPAVQNLLLAARAHGLGALMTIPQGLAPGRLEKILRLPKDVSLCAVVPVGYPMGKFGPVRRPPAESLISWEQYQEPKANRVNSVSTCRSQ